MFILDGFFMNVLYWKTFILSYQLYRVVRHISIAVICYFSNHLLREKLAGYTFLQVSSIILSRNIIMYACPFLESLVTF